MHVNIAPGGPADITGYRDDGIAHIAKITTTGTMVMARLLRPCSIEVWRSIISYLRTSMISSAHWWRFTAPFVTTLMATNASALAAADIVMRTAEGLGTRAGMYMHLYKPVASALLHFMDMYLVNVVQLMRRYCRPLLDFDAADSRFQPAFEACKDSFLLFMAALTTDFSAPVSCHN